MYTNIEAAKKLATTYRDLAKKKLDIYFENYSSGHDIMNSITGFGNDHTCTLCKSVGRHIHPMCKNCVWHALPIDLLDEYPVKVDDYPCIMHESYEAIEDADNPYDLEQALLNRSKLLQDAIFLAEMENELENENTGE